MKRMNLKDWQEDWGKRRDALAKLDKSVLVLLVVDWAYSVLPIFENYDPKDKRPRLALEAAEKYISSAVDAVAVNAAARAAASAALDAAGAAASVAWTASYAARAAYGNNEIYYASVASAAAADASAAVYVARAVASALHKIGFQDAAAGDAAAYTYKTYLHALGPTNKAFDKQWLTPTVQSLVQAEHPELPIIADSLEDAGCDNNDILQHLRSNPSFTRADWVWRQLT